jgi:transcriptional regulator with XRE-family HTH domain
MTPTPPSSGDPRGQEALDLILSELRAEVAVEGASMEEASTAHRSSDGLDDVLATLSSAALSPDAQSVVERLLSFGEGLTPASRQRMIAAAERGLRQHRVTHGMLAPMLEARREEHGLATAVLADELGLEESELLAIESGRQSVRALRPEQIVAWVGRLGLARQEAVHALRRSLGLPSATANYAQRRNPRDQAHHAADLALVEAVENLLSQCPNQD